MKARPFGHIMACCDFSPGSEKALDAAIGQCRLDNARLTIIHVVAPGLPALPGRDPRLCRGMSDHELAAKLHEYMDEHLLPKAAGLRVKIVLRRGHPSMEVMDQLQGDPADLLVVGSQGLSGMGLVLFGSVAERLVRRSGCSTLVVR